VSTTNIIDTPQLRSLKLEEMKFTMLYDRGPSVKCMKMTPAGRHWRHRRIFPRGKFGENLGKTLSFPQFVTGFSLSFP
jgi:hypothetical protein